MYLPFFGTGCVICGNGLSSEDVWYPIDKGHIQLDIEDVWLKYQPD
jgi:hypothetical protein